MVKQHADVRSIAVLVTGYAAGLLAYPNLAGPFMAQARFARILVAFTLPTTALVVDTLFRSLWTHDRVRSSNGAFASTYRAIIFQVLLFILALHALVMIELTDVMDAIGLRMSASRAVVVMLGLALIAIGNLLPRTRPNVAVGVRTTRTLANAQLWRQVHQVGGYATVGLGTVTALTGLVLSPEGIGIIVSAATIFAGMTVFVSYRKYARA